MLNSRKGTIIFEQRQYLNNEHYLHDRYNRDGSLLALADMAGNVRVHRVVNAMDVAKDPVWEFETSDITVSCEQNTITKNCVKKCSFQILSTLTCRIADAGRLRFISSKVLRVGMIPSESLKFFSPKFLCVGKRAVSRILFVHFSM